MLSRYAKPMAENSTVRIDVWLWAVRVYKTRSLAASACKNGRVTIDGNKAKPSSNVKIGSKVEVRKIEGTRILQAVQLLNKRVGAPVAAEAVIDTSPPAPPRQFRPAAVAVREPGAGRPTKRERRELDRLRGRSGNRIR
ncbi:Heat shock protein 15 [Dermatophilus congolensis]|uniref:Heat shock protein 15 n=2 Tax=Dermatophilus congolensis TaxID=1863 RepID=A0AA46BQ78_9MICO|nr:Heat shock protein 15 [Dermatophilus congolensis]